MIDLDAFRAFASHVTTATRDEGVIRRFWAKVEPEPNSGCWIWIGARRHGYGAFYESGRVAQAHRFSYRMAVGPIPAGLMLDHLCRMPSCVNPAHLEAVTNIVNSRRGLGGRVDRAKTTCPAGHQYDVVDLEGKRRCRACRNRLLRLRRAAARSSHAIGS